MRRYRFFLPSFYLLLSNIFCSCTSTVPPEEHTSKLINSFFEMPESEDAYIFFRFYDPVYKNPLYIANLLKTGIEITEVNDFSASHVAFSFSLDDCFLGLTSFTTPNLDYEICSDNFYNPYITQCDKKKSKAYIYALKVTKEERDAAVKIIQDNRNVTYDTMMNFIMADRSIKRIFVRKEEDKKLDIYGRTEQNTDEINDRENMIENKKFVCSTFSAYILYNSVQSCHDFFYDNTIDYHYLGVTDISVLPGMQKLFECTWEDYEKSAENFVNEHKEFKPFLTEINFHVKPSKV